MSHYRYLLVMLLLGGCAADKGQWYIHFVDGSEIRITQPSIVDRDKGCASRMYIVPTDKGNMLRSSTADRIKAKNMKSDGYTYRNGNGLRWVKYCDE